MIVYDNYKLSHTGIIKYTTFEGFIRKCHNNSLKNLVNYTCITGDIMNEEKTTRKLSANQSKKIRNYCTKLSYYSQKRIFKTKNSKTYSMKVAFITLTAPESTTTIQFLSAFDHFLDYLRRTANCVYVWKKELGSKSGHFHIHIMINNFIPYYIVSWKWKRLLISEGVIWPINNKGKDTSSHTRIELPYSTKAAGAYIAKYMSKAYELPKDCGYIWGKSEILDQCKELVFMEGELDYNELSEIKRHGKLINHDYVAILIIDLLKVKQFAPRIGTVFEQMYIEFSEKITLPQRFNYI